MPKKPVKLTGKSTFKLTGKPMSNWKYRREKHSIYKRLKAGMIGRDQYFAELEALRREHGKG